MTIAIINFGMGNIHSIQKATRLFSASVQYTADLEMIAKAKALVIPGDGAFSTAMQGLDSDLRTLIKKKIKSGCPVLGICIGFQILFQDSNEFQSGKTVSGLAVLPGKIRKFDSLLGQVRIPHIGWNTLQSNKENKWCKRLPAYDYAYFIHSYRAIDVPDEYVVAYTDYGKESFPAIVEKDNVLATQFHPEKSSTYGLSLLKNWVSSIDST